MLRVSVLQFLQGDQRIQKALMAMAAGTSNLTRCLSSVSLSTNSRYLPRFHSLSYSAINYSFTCNNYTTKNNTRFIVNVPKNMAPIHSRAPESSSDSLSIESVKKTITENPVVVYSKTWCSYSAEVKSLFKRLDVQAFVVELDQLGPQGSELLEALELLTGQHTVPNVFIGGKHIGGCSDTINLHREGKLQALLSEATGRKAEN